MWRTIFADKLETFFCIKKHYNVCSNTKYTTTSTNDPGVLGYKTWWFERHLLERIFWVGLPKCYDDYCFNLRFSNFDWINHHDGGEVRNDCPIRSELRQEGRSFGENLEVFPSQLQRTFIMRIGMYRRCRIAGYFVSSRHNFQLWCKRPVGWADHIHRPNLWCLSRTEEKLRSESYHHHYTLPPRSCFWKEL